MKPVVPLLGAMIALAGPANALPPAQLFAQRCAMCHQATGAGLPGQFPRIAGRAASIAQSPAGRHYLALVLLNGMVGTISADGRSVSGLMPSMAALPDGDIAAILTHVLTLGTPAKGKKPAAFTAAEIAAVRKEGGLSATAVGSERAKLAAKGLLP
ncbi:c-type cytochrome [Sphingomonas bacterium]|uniref:c-type cytochrome n=1 Tax=Sphingomonas bacterium TaxID=1895847 RepID=UPI0020C6F6F6|nr:cytochrome c [Sphingomonas bacterium]